MVLKTWWCGELLAPHAAGGARRCARQANAVRNLPCPCTAGGMATRLRGDLFLQGCTSPAAVLSSGGPALGSAEGFICPGCFLWWPRSQSQWGSLADAGWEWIPRVSELCWRDGGSGAELREPSPASPGRAAWRERWQQPGDGTSVLAGAPWLLRASVATGRLLFFWNFSVRGTFSLAGGGEERRSNFNNLIYYIICFISWCECS